MSERGASGELPGIVGFREARERLRVAAIIALPSYREELTSFVNSFAELEGRELVDESAGRWQLIILAEEVIDNQLTARSDEWPEGGFILSGLATEDLCVLARVVDELRKKELCHAK